MTTFFPIAFTVPQYVDVNGDPYSGAVLKPYRAGTTTNIVFANDSAGTTTAGSVQLNANGFPELSGNIIIPHIAETYKLALYPNQAAADSDTGAIWTIDNITLSGVDVSRFVNYAPDTGSANNYVISPSPAITSYVTGQIITLIPANTNTGASTLIVNGLAAQDIVRPDGSALNAGDMVDTGAYTLVYNGTNFTLNNPSTVEISKDTSPQLGSFLDTNGHMVQWSKGADVASAAALPILKDGNFFDVTGTTTITSINTSGHIGTVIKLQFDSALTLTHNATDLILPAGLDIVTAAGDVLEFVEYATGDWVCTNYLKASGSPIVVQDFTSSGTYTPTAGMSYCIVEAVGAGGGAGGALSASTDLVASSGGGAGAYCRSIISATTIGASQTVTIGAGGAGGVGSVNGSAGGATSLGSLVIAGGGSGGFYGRKSAAVLGGNGGTGSAGDIQIDGNDGGGCKISWETFSSPLNVFSAGGYGASSYFGGGSAGVHQQTGRSGTANSGAGGGGVSSYNNANTYTGGDGGSGRIIITEFFS